MNGVLETSNHVLIPDLDSRTPAVLGSFRTFQKFSQRAPKLWPWHSNSRGSKLFKNTIVTWISSDTGSGSFTRPGDECWRRFPLTDEFLRSFYCTMRSKGASRLERKFQAGQRAGGAAGFGAFTE